MHSLKCMSNLGGRIGQTLDTQVAKNMAISPGCVVYPSRSDSHLLSTLPDLPTSRGTHLYCATYSICKKAVHVGELHDLDEYCVIQRWYLYLSS